MSKIILVSNRLSVSAQRTNEGFSYNPSVGGLATGLSSFFSRSDSLWVGWSGLADDTLTPEEREEVAGTLRTEHKSVAVSLSSLDLDTFYYGFCNKAIWPLFHYFPTYVDYDPTLWAAYERVNKKFFEELRQVIEPGDFVWVHDYQLMLLPGMIREEFPNTRIGFFLHIPFPSYELFRLLPWRNDILNGLLGSDLIGFHTYDYARHFLSSVRRLLGMDNNLGTIQGPNRMTKVDVFPMGIDYEKYAASSSLPEVQKEIERIRQSARGRRIIFSVDRLDYSKGIPNRIQAFHRFLERYPDYHGKVELIMIVAPSRTEVESYKELKRELDELVSTINGTYGTIDWTPILYFYRTFPFEQLTAIYRVAEVLLVTPVRDGMNLIAKEYVAARSDYQGTVVLSETAGAAREMSESLIVNPSDMDGIAEAIRTALELSPEEQEQNNRRIHRRLSRYDVQFWAHDFMDKLELAGENRASLQNRRLRGENRKDLIAQYQAAGKRLLFLNYDGTLVGFGSDQTKGKPDAELLSTIERLAADRRNEVVIVSSRSREELASWLGHLDVGLVAGYGVWIKLRDGDWELVEQLNNDWMDNIRPILERYADRTPGSRIEESEYSLSWSYRKAEPELGAVRVSELRDALLSLTGNLNLAVIEGHNILEVKNSDINKGRAAMRWLHSDDWDYVLAIGDDWTDEELFSVLPPDSWSIKVGVDLSRAHWFLKNEKQVRELLHELV
ncbi:MAG: bifunctional alpha,alpha-trehalose-phosphate synthase (UDP-forming)/trehalose-phosphatase [Spirochaetaceae bacterium]|nr:MAG: bifunctional alpha,alpha-trehalose-phosphate synthase (UDP-forming)/trehalose-phosphatase [Spirochaetaceae bacterium]